jgi:tripartite-type tricarboxylate transporter receptor subunit TctC
VQSIISTATLALFPGFAKAQAYPTRPLRIVLPIPAGSPMDALGRIVANQLQSRLGQSVVIDNRPGGGQSIGARAVAIAEPDGYTLLLLNNGHYFGLTPNAGYDPVTSFTPVATLAEWNHVLVTRPDFPASSVAEVIDYANANPERVTFGYGTSTPPQILAETLKNVSGAKMMSVPYRSGATAITDVLGGRIDLNFGTTATLLPLIRNGSLKVLGYTGVQRHTSLPDVPTMIESGFPQIAFNPDSWAGLMLPAGAAAAVLSRLRTAIDDVLRSPEVVENFAGLGFDVMLKSPEQLSSFVDREAERWHPIVKASGLTPE